MVRGLGGKRTLIFNKMKVIKEFFCTQEKKAYKVGDTYTGKRTDIKDYLEGKKVATKKATKESK